MNDKNAVIKDARTLGVPKMLLLGLQHMFAMFGATILVPILVNNYFEGEGLSIPGNIDLCRAWYAVLPCMCQDESTGISGVIFCISGRLCYSSESGQWNVCQHDNG